jgi:hypothetical protein
VPGKPQRERHLRAVVGDSSDCRAGLSDNSDNPRTPGDETCYRWRTRCSRAWKKTLDKDVGNQKENDHGHIPGRLYMGVGNRLGRN